MVNLRYVTKRNNGNIIKYSTLSLSERIFDLVNSLLLGLLAITMLIPIIHVLSLSLSSADVVNLAGIHIIPKKFSIQGYHYVLNSKYIWSGYYNTIIRVVANTFLGILTTMGMAYALSKKNMPGRTFFTFFIIIPMFIAGGMIPSYLNIRNLGLLDSRWALILPLLAKPYFIIIMRNFFMSIPDSLEEAAEIDGANAIYILFRIILPVSKPIIATIGLWTIVDQWNRWFDCLIYIQNPNKYVLQVVLQRIIFDTSIEMMDAGRDSQMLISQEVIKNATIIVSIIPILAVYPFMQKYFVKGIMVGSLKG